VTNVSAGKKDRKTVIEDAEFIRILEAAGRIEDTFYRLRALALLSLVRLTGKRRSELSRLELTDFEHGETSLDVTFTLSKKRTENTLAKRTTKSLPYDNPLTKIIMNYLEYLSGLDPEPRVFLPSTHPRFGSGRYLLDPDRGIQPRQVYNVAVGVGPETWPHLYRETAASDVIRSNPTLTGIYEVMARLDLKRYDTGFNYLRRFAKDEIDTRVSLIKQTSNPA